MADTNHTADYRTGGSQATHPFWSRCISTPNKPCRESMLSRKADEWNRQVKGKSVLLLVRLIDITVKAITSTHDQVMVEMLEEERDALRAENKKLRKELRELKRKQEATDEDSAAETVCS